MVYVARTAGSAYMQVQLGVVAVYFEDGSTWPADWSAAGHPPSHPYAFDPLLIKAEGDKCADAAAVAAVATAMKSVKDVAFAEQEPQALEPKDRTVLPPHLRFSCRLEGPKAICRMPLETDRRGPQPAARAAERN
jgi:hypothetical protein